MGLASFDRGERENSLQQAIGVAAGVAQQQAIEAGAPAVLLKGGNPLPLTILRVDPPANARFAHPAAHHIKVGCGHPCRMQHRRRFQNVKHLCGAAASTGQSENLEEGIRSLALSAHAAIGDAKRNAALVAHSLKNSVDIGCIGFDVRNHHHDIVGLQIGTAVKEIEQLIV